MKSSINKQTNLVFLHFCCIFLLFFWWLSFSFYFPPFLFCSPFFCLTIINVCKCNSCAAKWAGFFSMSILFGFWLCRGIVIAYCTPPLLTQWVLCCFRFFVVFLFSFFFFIQWVFCFISLLLTQWGFCCCFAFVFDTVGLLFVLFHFLTQSIVFGGGDGCSCFVFDTVRWVFLWNFYFTQWG